jgi:hypothetical protein
VDSAIEALDFETEPPQNLGIRAARKEWCSLLLFAGRSEPSGLAVCRIQHPKGSLKRPRYLTPLPAMTPKRVSIAVGAATLAAQLVIGFIQLAGSATWPPAPMSGGTH